jgi:CcmD family protein
MRPTRLLRLAAVIAASLALAATPAPRASAQDAPPAAAAVAQPGASAPPGAPAAAPPRTLRAYWHVFIAYALAWLFLFGYALSLGRRFRNLERDVDALRGAS